MTVEEFRAMLGSFVRVAMAAIAAALVTTWDASPNQNLASWGAPELKAFGIGVLAATAVTLINYLREGDQRFGRGARR